MCSPASPITSDPAFFANCTAIEPTPPSGAGDDDGVTLTSRDGPHRRVGRRSGHEHGAGLLPGDIGWARGQILCLRDHELGLARTGVNEPDDLVTNREAIDILAEFLDDPREVATLTGWKRRRPHAVKNSLSDARLARVDPGVLHPYENLSRARNGPFHFGDMQNTDPAILVEPYCLWHCIGPHCAAYFCTKAG